MKRPVRKSKFYGAFVLNLHVDLHAIDATPARWRGDAGSSPLDGANTAANEGALALLEASAAVWKSTSASGAILRKVIYRR